MVLGACWVRLGTVLGHKSGSQDPIFGRFLPPPPFSPFFLSILVRFSTKNHVFFALLLQISPPFFQQADLHDVWQNTIQNTLFHFFCFLFFPTKMTKNPSGNGVPKKAQKGGLFLGTFLEPPFFVFSGKRVPETVPKRGPFLRPGTLPKCSK